MLNQSLLLLATLSASSCAGLPPGDMTDPHYWGDYFLDKYATERADAVNNLEPGPTPLVHPRTVLLITGVTIPAEWFDPIVLRLQRDGFRPVVYEPPDLLSGDLFDNAERLGDVIEQVQADSGQDKIDVLAECTGGLIARYYIQSLGGDQHVSRLVTFISPQHGVDKAPLAASIAGWPALYDLSPGSDFLHAVNDVPLPDDVAVTSIYSCTDEYIQPFTTSIIPGAKNIELCDGYIGHFRFFYDPDIYLIMHDALIDGVDDSDPADPGMTDPTDPSDPGSTDDPTDPMAEPQDGAVGCSTGGGAGGGFALLLLGLVAVSRRRRRRD